MAGRVKRRIKAAIKLPDPPLGLDEPNRVLECRAPSVCRHADVKLAMGAN